MKVYTHRKNGNGKLIVCDNKAWQLLRTKLTRVFRHFNLLSHMMVLENVMAAPVKVLGISKDVAKARAIKYLNNLGFG